MQGASIPFNRPYLTGVEERYVAEVLKDGHLSGDGAFTRAATEALVAIMGAPAALLTTSCTHALEMAAMLLDLAPGDEVIVPSFTFTSTVNAFCLQRATAVFVDCRPDTLNIDERLIEDAITQRTRAIVVVHYAGIAAEMDAINDIAARHGLVVVEDNAHGLGGSYRGRALGTFGAIATQSFHETKNVQCGEGGAIVFNDMTYHARAEVIREKGTNRSQFFRGMVDKYRWVDLGSSYLPSEILAAVLAAQLESFDDIQQRRMRVWSTYDRELADWAQAQGVVRPTVPADREHPAHLYYLLLPDLESRQGLLAHLAAHGIMGTFHYQPLHSAPAGVAHGRTAAGGCPVTDEVADRLVRLPLYAGMTSSEQDRVLTAVRQFRIGGAPPPRPRGSAESRVA
jgi:dTDP-4-amino-4,6-dideoxygalactose transaminase